MAARPHQSGMAKILAALMHLLMHLGHGHNCLTVRPSHLLSAQTDLAAGWLDAMDQSKRV